LAWPPLSLDFAFTGASLGLLCYLLHLLFHPLFSGKFSRISGGTLDLFGGSLSRIWPNKDKWGRSGREWRSRDRLRLRGWRSRRRHLRLKES
jgi:hypothetical protein